MDWLPLVCSMNKRMMKMKFWSEHDTVGALLIDHHGQYRRPLTSDIPVHNHYPLWSVPQNNNNNQNCNRFMSLKCFDIFLYFPKISKKKRFCFWNFANGRKLLQIQPIESNSETINWIQLEDSSSNCFKRDNWGELNQIDLLEAI